MGLVGLRPGVELPVRCPAAGLPGGGKALDEPLDGSGVLVVGTEAPGFGEGGAFGVEPFRQEQVTGQGFQDVLPGADGLGS